MFVLFSELLDIGIEDNAVVVMVEKTKKKEKMEV
jgi:hypothetical protein